MIERQNYEIIEKQKQIKKTTQKKKMTHKKETMRNL